MGVTLIGDERPVVESKTVAATYKGYIEGELTDEAAIDHLQKSGWLLRHDRELSMDSLTCIVNRLMQDGNKAIRVSIDPWRWDECVFQTDEQRKAVKWDD